MLCVEKKNVDDKNKKKFFPGKKNTINIKY